MPPIDPQAQPNTAGPLPAVPPTTPPTPVPPVPGPNSVPPLSPGAPVAVPTAPPVTEPAVAPPPSTPPAPIAPPPPTPVEPAPAPEPMPQPVSTPMPAPVPPPVAAPAAEPAIPTSEPVTVPTPAATPPPPSTSVPPMPGSPVSPVDPSLGLPVDHDAATIVPPPVDATPPKSRKKLFIILGCVVAALLILGGVWAAFGMLGAKKASPEAPASTPDASAPDTSELGGSSTTGSTTGNTSPAAITYGTVTKHCYTFSLPMPNNTNKDATSCAIDAVFGAASASRIVVIPSTTVFNTLEEALVAAKQAYKLTGAVDRKISLGGSDAYETTYTSSGGKKAVKIIVDAHTHNYPLGSDAITGFQINMPATSPTDLAAVAKLESTWSWK